MADPLRFGRYTLIRVLGRGSLGVVYHAKDALKSREVAVKVIKILEETPSGTKVSQLQDSLERDFRGPGMLAHPAIVGLHGVGQQREHAYLVMEYVPGESLAHQFKSGVEFSHNDVAEITEQIGSALSYAHAHDVVHGDLNPSNILVARGERFRLTDFGSAAFCEHTLGRSRANIGHPAFTAPELATGGSATPASDQFALGAVVYRALTGDRPFAGERAATVSYQVAHVDPPPPASLDPRLSEELSRAVLRSLEKDPSQRFPSCDAFVLAVLSGLTAPHSTGDDQESWDVAASRPSPYPKARSAPVVHAEAVPSQSTAQAPLVPEAWVDLEIHGADHVRPTTRSTHVSNATASADGAETPSGRYWVTAAVAGLLTLGVGALAVWVNPFGLFGPPHVEATVGVDSLPPDQELAVWLGGRPLGVSTPADIPVAGDEGDEIRLELVRDDTVVASTLIVLNSELAPVWVPEVAVPVRPIRYEVRSEPEGALVRLDGHPIARPTPVDVDLFAGQTYHIEVERDGYETAVRTVDPALVDPDVTTLMFPLTRVIRSGRVYANAEVPLTVVATSVDGEFERRDEGESPSLELPPGEYTVVVTARDIFFSGDTEISLREGEELQLPPVPETVDIVVFDAPGNATVQIDDFEPFPSGGLRTVAAGQHRFTFEWPSGARVETTVNVERDEQQVSAREPS